MKRLYILALLLTGASSGSSVQHTDSTTPRRNDERIHLRLEHEWAKVLGQRDGTTLDRILGEGVAFTSPRGRVVPRAPYISHRQSGSVHEFATLDDLKVRTYGTTAIVTGRTTSAGRSDNRDPTSWSERTDTWIKSNGNWQVVASHWSTISYPEALADAPYNRANLTPGARTQAPEPARSVFGEAARGNQVSLSAEQEVWQVLRELTEALLWDDFAALDRIYADDYTLTAANGESRNKARRMVALKSGDVKNLSIDRDDVSVRVYGDAAVATGRTTFKVRIKGEERSKVQRFIHVLVKRQGKWQIVAQQMTRIAQK